MTRRESALQRPLLVAGALLALLAATAPQAAVIKAEVGVSGMF